MNNWYYAAPTWLNLCRAAAINDIFLRLVLEEIAKKDGQSEFLPRLYARATIEEAITCVTLRGCFAEKRKAGISVITPRVLELALKCKAVGENALRHMPSNAEIYMTI